MAYVTGILIVWILTAGIYKLFELFVRRKERTTIIEKLSENPNFQLPNMSMDTGFSIFPGTKPSSFGTLKISLLMAGIGIGLIVAFLIQCYGGIEAFDREVYNDNWIVRDRVNELKFVLYTAGITIFGGLGLFSAYLIEAKSGKKES